MQRSDVSSHTLNATGFISSLRFKVLSDKKAAHFKQSLEGRIAELNRVLADAHQENHILSEEVLILLTKPQASTSDRY